MKKHFDKAVKAATGTVAAAAALAMTCPACAFASDLSVILPDPRETIPMLVAFVVLVIVLSKFGWPLLDGIIVKREETVKEALEKSEHARIESERVLVEYREQLAQARQEASTIVEEAKQSGEAVRAEIVARAQAEANEIVAKAHQQIESEKKAAIAELQSSVADLTVATMAKVIGEDFTDADHRKLIEASVAKAGNLDA